MPVLRIAASVIVVEGRMLLVRKRGTEAFMQPGGKLEPGESGAECLVRELEEELGLRIPVAVLAPLGRFGAPAANEPDHVVDCDVYRVPAAALDGQPLAVQAELEELRWSDAADLAALAAAGRLAPLTRDHLAQFLAG